MSSSGLLAPALMNCFWLRKSLWTIYSECHVVSSEKQPWYTWTFPLGVPVQAAFSLLSCLRIWKSATDYREESSAFKYFLLVEIKLGYYKLISSVLILCLFFLAYHCIITTPSKSTFKSQEELRIYSSRWPITRRWKKPLLMPGQRHNPREGTSKFSASGAAIIMGL